jgi:hypothetical protein
MKTAQGARMVFGAAAVLLGVISLMWHDSVVPEDGLTVIPSAARNLALKVCTARFLVFYESRSEAAGH